MIHHLVDARVEVLARVVAVLDVAEAPRPVGEVVGQLRQRQLDLFVAELSVAERGAQRLPRPDGARGEARCHLDEEAVVRVDLALHGGLGRLARVRVRVRVKV
eukprot:scaffold106641_cov63-Phaeocystis_antarctica.AAC.2